MKIWRPGGRASGNRGACSPFVARLTHLLQTDPSIAAGLRGLAAAEERTMLRESAKSGDGGERAEGECLNRWWGCAC